MVDKAGPVETEMCGIWTDCKNEYPSKVYMFALTLPTEVTVLHQQATVRAHSLMTLLADIKSDHHI